jgi:hypothetical protein
MLRHNRLFFFRLFACQANGLVIEDGQDRWSAAASFALHRLQAIAQDRSFSHWSFIDFPLALIIVIKKPSRLYQNNKIVLFPYYGNAGMFSFQAPMPRPGIDAYR